MIKAFKHLAQNAQFQIKTNPKLLQNHKHKQDTFEPHQKAIEIQ